MALYDLLLKQFKVNSVIYGDIVSGPQSIGIPERYEKFVKALRRRPQFEAINSLAKNFGIYLDIADSNPKVFADNIIRHKNKDARCGKIIRSIENSDAVVINGEGDMIFTTPPRRQFLFLLATMELAVLLKKPFFFVNGMASDCPRSGRNNETFQYAAGLFRRNGKPVILRDPTSAALVKEMSAGCEVKCRPDALFTWRKKHQGRGLKFSGLREYVIPFPEFPAVQKSFEFVTPYVCVGGSSSAAWDQKKARASYSGMIETLKATFGNVILIEPCNGDRFLRAIANNLNLPLIPVETGIHVAAETLANASLFISGRYHPSILASLGGTPCVFLGSNAHKTRSLQDVLGYETVVEFGDFPSSEETRNIVALGQDFMSQGDRLRDKIRGQSSELDEQAASLVSEISTCL